jgi:hypothetical protein
MKRSIVWAASIFAMGAMGIGRSSQAASLGVDFPADAISDFGPSFWNLGWAFTANASVDVVGLGNWLGDTPFFQDQQVGLWDSSGDLLASVYVTGSETPVGAAPWVFEPITPVRLTAGATYVVGAQGGADYTGQASATVDPRITYLEDRYTSNDGANSPLVEPIFTEGYTSPSTAGWFGGNIELANAIPEPSTWTMMLFGFAGLGFAGWSARRKTTSAA